jgi:hypothetical protein
MDQAVLTSIYYFLSMSTVRIVQDALESLCKPLNCTMDQLCAE